MELAEIGAVPQDGSNRVALTEEDAQGQQLFSSWARRAGCTLTRDTIGNLFATRAGIDPGRAAVVVGSHLDTQPYGGRFDGPVGVLAGLEIVRTLNDARITTHAPVVVASWANEEGARFPLPLTGSSVFAGLLGQQQAEEQAALDGPTFGEELRRLGLDGPESPGSFAIGCYFELHIEQNTLLESSGTDIGIVERGQGVRAVEVTVQGSSAHAGTTAMTDRRDALLVAARIVELANRTGHDSGTLVTVGRLEVRPNSRSVVPGEVTLVVDIRHPEAARIDEVEQRIGEQVAAIAATGNVDCRAERALDIPVVEFDAGCRDAIGRACADLGLSSMPLISGAGHDAMSIARIAPASLVFIPCREGVSHHPDEYASPDQVGAGCDVLLRAVLERSGATVGCPATFQGE